MEYSLELIGKNLKKLRNHRKWKFSYVEKNTGISADRLRRLEVANNIITYTELYKLSRLYEITIDELVYNEIE